MARENKEATPQQEVEELQNETPDKLDTKAQENKEATSQQEVDELQNETPDKLDTKAQEIFALYPKCEKLFKTDDALYFFERCDAVNHSIGLKNKTIDEITRK